MITLSIPLFWIGFVVGVATVLTLASMAAALSRRKAGPNQR